MLSLVCNVGAFREEGEKYKTTITKANAKKKSMNDKLEVIKKNREWCLDFVLML